MNITIDKIPFSTIDYFSSRDVAYTETPELFENVIKYLPRLDSFKRAITNKAKSLIDRRLLVDALKAQYEKVTPSDITTQNIESLLSNNSFTIITAHQPNLFTGPLYIIYKIICVINTCEKLTQEFPGNNFVPVFISGGEDHDFEEMNHFHFFQNKIEWQSNQTGPVGRMNTQGLSDVLASLTERLGTSANADQIHDMLAKGIQNYDNYGSFVFYLVNELFSKFGLVYLNLDNKELKKSFIPEFKKELIERKSQELIEKTQKEIEQLGYKSQAHARLINLFYLQEGRRDRIELIDDRFHIVDTELYFTESEILAELENSPEKFSPNVALRPLYQEKVLPNLAYIGGGGELAYWMERKAQFEYFNIPFPILMRRNSVHWIDSSNLKQIKKLGFSAKEIFEDEELLIKSYIKSNTDVPLDIAKEKDEIISNWELIAKKAESIDPTYAKSLLAEMQKLNNNLNQISGRFIRIEKHKNETELNKIRKIKAKLFPGNGLQERYDNFFQYYLKYGDQFIQTLKDHLDPFDYRLSLILEE
jgi:bacillithiol biosynthesis cysteine-adding enzyme BshC